MTLPIHADQETARKIHERIELAITSEEPTIAYAWPELDPRIRRREMAWAAIRWGYQSLAEVDGAPAGGRNGEEP